MAPDSCDFTGLDPEEIMEICYTISMMESGVVGEIESAISNDIDRIRDHLRAAEHLGLIQDADLGYEVHPSFQSEIFSAKISERPQILRQALLSHQQFRFFVDLLDKGYEPSEAADKVVWRFNISFSPQSIHELYVRIGQFAGLVERSIDGPKRSRRFKQILSRYWNKIYNASLRIFTAEVLRGLIF